MKRKSIYMYIIVAFVSIIFILSGKEVKAAYTVGSTPFPAEYASGVIDLTKYTSYSVGSGLEHITGQINSYTYDAYRGTNTSKSSNCWIQWDNAAFRGNKRYDVRIYFWLPRGDNYTVTYLYYYHLFLTGTLGCELHVYEHGTTNEVDFKGVMYFTDCDYHEGYRMVQGVQGVWLYPDTVVEQVDGNLYRGTLDNPSGIDARRQCVWITFRTNASTPLRFNFDTENNPKNSSLSANLITITYKVASSSEYKAGETLYNGYYAAYGTYSDTYLGDEVDGYTFDGWYTNDSLTGDKVTSSTYNMLTSNLTLYGKYERSLLNYTVKYIDINTDQEIETAKVAQELYGNTIYTADEIINEINNENGKYVFVESDVDSINIGVDEEANCIKLYYSKESNVITKYIDENSNEEITEEVTQTYKEGDTYTTEKKSFDGYLFTKDTGNTSGTLEKQDIEVVYYYKKISAGVEVKYVDQVTGDEIETPVTMNGLEKDPYTTEAKEVSGYVLVKTPDNATGEMTVDKITVTYEYRKLVNVEVRYVDENSNEEIITPEIQNLKEGDTYTTEKKSFDGYTFTKSIGSTTGTVAREDIEVIYYYKKTSAGIEVKYIDQVTGLEIETMETKTGLEKDPYTTEAKDIDDYVLVVTPDNANGEMTVEKITIVYEYRMLSDVTTKYIDENTNQEIVTAVTDTYKEGDTYTTEKKSFDGYTFIKDTENTSGTVVREDIEVTYYYKKNSAGIEVKYIDQATGLEIADSVIETGLEKDPYTTEAKDIDDYVLVVIPDNATGEMTVEKITIVYEYRLLSDVTVKYIDENTNEEIVTAVTGTYKEGDTYTTEKKSFNGYTFTKDTGNTSGTVAREDIEVTYYYKKISAGIEVKYIDQVTRAEIATSTYQSGLEKDPYTTEAKNVAGYELVLIPDNASGEMKVEKITIVYEYRLLSDVTVKYIDENTNQEIVTAVTNTYKEGDSYTTEKKSFDGYTFIKDNGNTSGTVARENIEVKYYYKKNSAGIEVRFIDQVNGEEIATSISKIGLENDAYTTEAKEIDGYELVVIPSNASGKMTVGKTTIIYEYRKLSNVIAKYVDENTGVEITEEVENTYKEGDMYTTEKKSFEGYTFTKDTNNTSGVVQREDIEVVYYYKKISAGIEAIYIDQVTGEQIAESIVKTGLENDEYVTEAKDIEDYVLVNNPLNASGKMTVEKITIVYEYRKLANVITKHIDANTGKEIIDDIVDTYKEGDNYKVLPQNLAGYVLVEEPDVKEGVIAREDITKIFKYKKISSGLVVKYVDEISNELLDEKTYTGNEKDIINLEELSFESYILTKRPADSTVELTVEPQERYFYYKKVVDIEVVGIDKHTGKELYSKIQSGVEGTEYQTQPVVIPGYDILEEPENKNGIYKKNSEKVIYIYSKIAGNVTVKYVDKDTNENLDGFEIKGHVGDDYSTDKKDFEDYNFVEVIGNPKGKLEENSKEIIYYYEKKNGKVVVTYVDTLGNVLLSEEHVGKVKDEYEIIEKGFKNYIVIERPDETSGKFIDGTIELKFVLEKVKGKIKVNFIDREGNTLFESIITEGEVDEEYYYEALEKEGYTIAENAKIEVKYIDGEIVIDVVYEKIEEPPATGDINVVMYVMIALVSMLVISKKVLNFSKK